MITKGRSLALLIVLVWASIPFLVGWPFKIKLFSIVFLKHLLNISIFFGYSVVFLIILVILGVTFGDKNSYPPPGANEYSF